MASRSTQYSYWSNVLFMYVALIISFQQCIASEVVACIYSCDYLNRKTLILFINKESKKGKIDKGLENNEDKVYKISFFFFLHFLYKGLILV